MFPNTFSFINVYIMCMYNSCFTEPLIYAVCVCNLLLYMYTVWIWPVQMDFVIIKSYKAQ